MIRLFRWLNIFKCNNKEIWRDVPGFEDFISFSNKGNVKRLPKVTVGTDGRRFHYNEKILNVYISSNGYPIFSFIKDGKKFEINAAILCYELFGEQYNHYKYTIKFKDGNLLNCSFDNLYLVLNKQMYPKGHNYVGYDSKENLYQRWSGMKYRCNNPKSLNYKNYGGRGIKVCDEWNNSYLKFRKWALNNGYKKELSIDRIDNDGNYEPGNCRWTTIEVQNSNKRPRKKVLNDKI